MGFRHVNKSTVQIMPAGRGVVIRTVISAVLPSDGLDNRPNFSAHWPPDVACG